MRTRLIVLFSVLLAAAILSLSDKHLRERLLAYREAQTQAALVDHQLE